MSEIYVTSYNVKKLEKLNRMIFTESTVDY